MCFCDFKAKNPYISLLLCKHEKLRLEKPNTKPALPTERRTNGQISNLLIRFVLWKFLNYFGVVHCAVHSR